MTDSIFWRNMTTIYLIMTARRNINNFWYADDTILMAERKEGLKNLPMKVKESKKVGLKLNIKKTKVMTSVPITSRQIEGEMMKTVTDLICLGSKITADCDWSHEIKRQLPLGRKAMINIDSILESRDITASKDPCSQSYGFSSNHIRMWELGHKEDWAPKNWCFWAVVLEKTLESPLDCKEI